MFLKRLEIHGFKSFMHKTTLEFGQGMVAVVGPNGSGKSNVADSLRWVLGEQSAKLMRGKKADDVIFAGSDKKIRLGFAEVSATFDNSDHRIPVDSAEVSIGRRVDRSGESLYLLNGNHVRLLDIVDLVLKSNIGTSRYTVIGQGTIDQMIFAGPSEVKSLVDEASGVKAYYIKRERTLRRLEQTAQNLIRVEDLIAEIEPRLKSLRRQAKKMQARTEIETELKMLQREFFGKTYWQLKPQIDNYVKDLEVLAAKRVGLETELSKFKAEAEKLESAGGSHAQNFREIQTHFDNLQNQKNKLLEELSMVRGKMQSQKTFTAGDAKSLQVELHTLEKEIAEVQKQVQETKKLKETSEQLLPKQNAVLQKLSASLENLYIQSQNPKSLNWGQFDQALQDLDTIISDFYNKLEHNLPWQQIVPIINQMKQKFAHFKSVAKQIKSSPQAEPNSIQSQISALQKEKEQLIEQIQSADLGLSRSKMQLEFLEKEQERLEQKKLHINLDLKKAQSKPDEFINSLISEEERVQKEVDRLAQEITKLDVLFKQQQEQENQKQKNLRQVEGHFRDKQDELSELKDKISNINIEKARFDTQLEVLVEEMKRILGENILREIKEQPVSSQTHDIENRILKLKNQLEILGGMDELTLKEYQETEARYTNLSTQVADLKKSMQDLRSIMDELDEHIKLKFNEAFHKINEKFEYYFRILFNGGRAYLSLLKAEEPKENTGQESPDTGKEEAQEEHLRPEEKVVQRYEKGASNIIGIDIKATPPGKKLTHIQALSGGERSLTSIALLCSLLTCFPSPFVVLDEVDAALDDANTIRFGQILGTLSHQTQFITITHNRETMALADILYGVTMGDDGVSKLLSVKLEQAKQFAK